MKKIIVFVIIIIIVLGVAFIVNQNKSYDEDSWRQIIPDSCLKFNDGCNECFREKPGDQKLTCTLKYCGGEYQKPVCLD